MTRPKVRNVAMAVSLAGIGAGAFIIIGLGTTLSAMTQLFLAVVGISSFVAATFTICHVVPPMGHAFVIREQKGPRVVRGIAFLPPWQHIYSVPLTTLKWIEVSFDKPPYPKTLDWLPVRVKVQAEVAFMDKDEALISIAGILANMEEVKLYEGLENNLKGIIKTVLSEQNYQQHIEGRDVFEKAIEKYWYSRPEQFTLNRINLLEIEQVDLKEAGLGETELSRAKITTEKIKAEENAEKAKNKDKSAKADALIKKIEEEGKRNNDDEEHQTKVNKIQKDEKQKRMEEDEQQKTELNKLQKKDVIASANTKNEISRLEREVSLAKKNVESEEANRIAKIADKNTALELEKIHTVLLKNRAQGELDLEKQYIEVRRKELEMLKTNKDGDLRYLLAKEAFAISVEQAKALAAALGKARIIGAIGDLPQIEKILKTPIAFREILAGFLDVMDDELVQGVGRFFRGVASIRKETQSPAPKTNSSTQTVWDGVKSQTSSTSQDASASKKNEAPPPPNDGNFDN